jgi:glycerophosphoryl diester phosphodiesterase
LESRRKRNSNHNPALIIGHRGASAVAPENTLAAFQMAIAMGADGIELDVQLSADGEPVVIHDKRVDRTSDGAGYVAELTVAQLDALDAAWLFKQRLKTRPRLRAKIERLAGSPGPGYTLGRQPIPRLTTVLEHLSGSGLARIYVEIKGSEATRQELLTRTLAAIQRLNLQAIVTVLSFDHSISLSTKHLSPALRTAVTIPGLVRKLPTARSIVLAAQAAKADEVALHFSVASARIVHTLHEEGLEVSVWTANRKLIMRRLVALGVDSIMTNHVDRLRSVVEGYDSRALKQRAG